MTATLLDQIAPLRRASHADGRNVHQPGVALGDGAAISPATAPVGATPSEPPARLNMDVATSDGPARSSRPSYAAAMVDIVPIMPTIAAFATVYAYLGGPSVLDGLLHRAPLLTGAGAALLVGAVAMLVYRPLFTAAEDAHRQSYAEIRQRVDGLATQLAVLRAMPTTEATISERLAIEEAAAHLRALEQDLAQGGPQWSLGTGYVEALTRLHRAEEVLIAVQPADQVLAGALFDELRLTGSTVPGRDRLVERLRLAAQMLQPTASAIHHALPLPSPADRAGSLMTLAVAGADGEAGPVPTAAPANRESAVDATGQVSSVDAARMTVREIRRVLNDFRDESRARLIRSRGRLLGTMTVTGAITYVLLAFAVTMSNGQTVALDNPIAAAAAIYLVGAVVGLFNRLYVESGDDAAGEDYGLARARLLLTPMLSGLAAVGGVLITGMVSGIVDVNAITPTPLVVSELAASAEQGPLVTRIPLSLSDVFNLQAYPFALVLAAMFGLMPRTFLERLHRAGEQSRLDLRSTMASQPETAVER